jgi:hypothetical protein
MRGTPFRRIVMLAALAGLAVTFARAEELKQPPAPAPNFKSIAPPKKKSSFYSSFLAPRLDQRLHDKSALALDFTNRSANQWMHNPESVEQIEKSAIRATKSAIKRYAVEQLGLDNWSVPLKGGGGQGLDAMKTESGGTRLRLGFSHRRPRADVIVPSEAGRFVFSVDGRGNVGAAFETPTSNFRFHALIEPSEHQATFGLVRRF